MFPFFFGRPFYTALLDGVLDISIPIADASKPGQI
jgi:hypothetical protein